MPRSCRHSLRASYGENRFTFGAETAYTICMFQMNNYVKLHKNYVLQVHQRKKKKQPVFLNHTIVLKTFF